MPAVKPHDHPRYSKLVHLEDIDDFAVDDKLILFGQKDRLMLLVG